VYKNLEGPEIRSTRSKRWQKGWESQQSKIKKARLTKLNLKVGQTKFMDA